MNSNEINDDVTGDSNMNYTEMTEKEKTLLISAFGEQERINNGNLLGFQYDALIQIRKAQLYLDSKYGEKEPEIISFSPVNKLTGHSEFIICSPDTEEYLMIAAIENGSYVFSDTYYSFEFEDKYNLSIQNILKEEGISAVVVTDFPMPLGSECGFDISIEKFNEISPKVTRYTRIYTDAINETYLQDKIHSALSNEGYYGSYIVFFVTSLSDKTIMELETENSSYDHIVFNCFDVD